MEMIRPSNASDLAEALTAAATSGATIALRGAGSKDAMGGPVPDAQADLRLDRMSGILQYEPHDLTIQVAAGTPWQELNAVVTGQGQMLPLDPPRAALPPPWPRSDMAGCSASLTTILIAASLSGWRVKAHVDIHSVADGEVLLRHAVGNAAADVAAKAAAMRATSAEARGRVRLGDRLVADAVLRQMRLLDGCDGLLRSELRRENVAFDSTADPRWIE